MKKILIGILISSVFTLVSCGSEQVQNTQSTTANTAKAEEQSENTSTPKKEKFKLDAEKFMSDNNITLKAIDVEFDMGNNVDNSFLIEGKASLSDYYNYEYRDDNKNKFSVQVSPLSNNAGDYWHVYFDREEFKDLYELLKRGPQNILVKAVNPADKYREGMGNLATGEAVSFDKSLLDSSSDIVSKDLSAFMTKNNIELNYMDVEYNIENNLDNSFAIEGKADLSDYFNYNFSDKEKEYFNVSLKTNNKASNYWHLYFDREQFKDLFDTLKGGSKNIMVKAIMPSNLYEDGMNNMAVCELVEVK